MDVVRKLDEIFTDVHLRSTEPQENENFESPGEIHPESTNDELEDQQSSGGSDTIVPEVLDDETDMIVENESPRGGKYNLGPNPTPNFTDEYRY